MAIFTNAPQNCVTPTYDGSGQVVHPSVVDMLLEHGIPQWNGYRYWQLVTGYAAGTGSQHEDPHLIASNDRLNWEVPTVANYAIPLDNEPGAPGSYNNDPELVYDPDTNIMRCYYMKSNVASDFDDLYLIEVDNTLTAGTRQLLIHTTFSELLLSPAIWRESANQWHLWYVGVSAGVYNIYYRFSTEGKSWGSRQICNSIVQETWPTLAPWHGSVKYNTTENRLECVMACMVGGSINAAMPLVHIVCPDPTQPTVWDVLYTDILLEPSVSGWDNYKLYRTSLVLEDIAGSTYYHLWYSAQGQNEEWWEAYVAGYIVPPSYTNRHGFAASPTATGPKIGATGDRIVLVDEGDPNQSRVKHRGKRLRSFD